MNKIIILSFDFPPNNGGISRLCGEIVKGFEHNHIPYHVVTNVASDKPNENVTRIVAKRGEVECKILLYIRRYTSKDDIILCDTWHPAASIAMLSGRKYFILAHGAEYLPGKTLFRSKILPQYRKLVLRLSTGIIANSNYTAKLVNSLANGLNVIAIPLAIDAELFHPTVSKNTDDILRICSISRLEQFKGHDFLLSTIADLPSEYKCKIRLEIGGKGPYKSALEQQTKDLALDKIISFKGYIPEGEINDFYSRNDLFILCTREEKDNCNVEGFGLVFVEAQACGTAVIGTNAGGIPDAIKNGKGGWLIEQDSKTELSSILKKLVDDKGLAQRQCQIARARVLEECSQKNYINRLIRYIYDVAR